MIYTDSETWAGDVHPAQALRDYRQRVGHRRAAGRGRHGLERLLDRRPGRPGDARRRRLRHGDAAADLRLRPRRSLSRRAPRGALRRQRGGEMHRHLHLVRGRSRGRSGSSTRARRRSCSSRRAGRRASRSQAARRRQLGPTGLAPPGCLADSPSQERSHGAAATLGSAPGPGADPLAGVAQPGRRTGLRNRTVRVRIPPPALRASRRAGQAGRRHHARLRSSAVEHRASNPGAEVRFLSGACRFTAPWPRGEARACNARNGGSIPPGVFPAFEDNRQGARGRAAPVQRLKARLGGPFVVQGTGPYAALGRTQTSSSYSDPLCSAGT